MSDAPVQPHASDALRVGIDVREWRSGTSTGIARVITGLLRWAGPNTRHRFLLFGNQHTEFRVTGERIESHAEPEGARLLWDQRVLPRSLARGDVDVLWSPYYKRPLRSPCPVVVTANDLIDLHFPPAGAARRLLLPWWMRLMLRGASHVLTLSEHSRRDIIERLGITPSHVSSFPLAVDQRFRQDIETTAVERVRARYGLPEGYVLYVGRCAPHKNVATLTGAWRRLPADLRSRFALVLAGADSARFDEAAARAGVAALTPGHIADADMPALYAGATLMCFPSLYEGFGLPPLEAMACGTPVAAADATSIPEVVGDAAMLLAASDEIAWSDAIATLLTDDAARAALIARGSEQARGYTDERSATAILAALAAAASGRSR
jgi:glycosyltransferase involved in cell wall biosynthesis